MTGREALRTSKSFQRQRGQRPPVGWRSGLRRYALYASQAPPASPFHPASEKAPARRCGSSSFAGKRLPAERQALAHSRGLQASGEKRPTAEQETHLHHDAHEKCFIANSVKTAVIVVQDDGSTV